MSCGVLSLRQSWQIRNLEAEKKKNPREIRTTKRWKAQISLSFIWAFSSAKLKSIKFLSPNKYKTKSFRVCLGKKKHNPFDFFFFVKTIDYGCSDPLWLGFLQFSGSDSEDPFRFYHCSKNWSRQGVGTRAEPCT